MKRVALFMTLGLIFVGALLYVRGRSTEPVAQRQVVEVRRGDLNLSVKATGSVLPQNRLVVHLATAGRIESLLVQEGDRVHRGQLLAWVSSDERAALLDAASARGETETARWREFFKATPLYSPIDGMVIARAVEPGQSLSSSDTVLVLSNRLVVTTDVDETDLAKIRQGQACVVTLDAYPDRPLAARVSHVAYEAKTVNNVTIYEVEVAVARVPATMRSGMTASVNFITAHHEGALLLPVSAVQDLGSGAFVELIDPSRPGPASKRAVSVGLNDGTQVEITSGLDEGARVLSADVDMATLSATAQVSNPFFNPPKRRGKAANNAGNGPPSPPGQ